MSLLVLTGCSGQPAVDEPGHVTGDTDRGSVTAPVDPDAATAVDDSVSVSEPTDPDSVIAVVDERGFEANLGGIVVTGPPGVANPGTKVSVKRSDARSPDPDAEIVTAVDVVMGDGQQPQEPIEITFALDQRPSDAVDYALLRSDTGQENYLGMDYVVEGDQLVVTTDHLSTFSLVRFNPLDWLSDLTTQLELALGLQYPKPDCVDENFGHSPDLGDYYFTASGSGLGTIYLCAGRSPESDLSMQFYSNGPVAWVVTADPAPPSTMPIVQLRLGDLLATSGYRITHGYPDDRVILTPGARVALRSTEEQTPVRYAGQVDPLWGAVALGVEAALGVASMGTSEAFEKLSDVADLQDATSCMTGLISVGTDPELGPAISASTTCIQRMMSSAAKPDGLLLFRLGIVSRLVLVAPQGVLAVLIAEHNDEFTVELHPPLIGGPVEAVHIEAPAGGRGLVIDGEPAPEGEAESWLIERLGQPDQVIELTNCLRAGIPARQITWGGLTITILTEPIPQEVYMYGFAYPPGSVNGWEYDVARDRDLGGRPTVETEGISLPTDLDTLRHTFVAGSNGWDYADVIEVPGVRYFQAFSGDVTSVAFYLEDDDTVLRSEAGLNCRS